MSFFTSLAFLLNESRTKMTTYILDLFKRKLNLGETDTFFLECYSAIDSSTPNNELGIDNIFSLFQVFNININWCGRYRKPSSDFFNLFLARLRCAFPPVHQSTRTGQELAALKRSKV